MSPLALVIVAAAWADDPAPSDPPPSDPPPSMPAPSEPAPATPAPATPAPATPAPAVDEAALFGGAPVDEGALFGGGDAPPTPGGTDADIAATLAEADKRLEFGGQLWLQLQSSFAEDTDAAAATVSSPNVFDLFADARPNDRVRVYTRARVNTDYTIESGDTDFAGNPLVGTRVILDQMWIKGDAGRKLFVTLGYQRIKWGTGRFWNPTDFLNVVLNPLAVFDVRTGVPLLKFHVPVESLGLNLYAIATARGARRLDEVGGAVRAEWFYKATEVSLSTYLQKDAPLRFGGDLSTALGPFDVRVEGALTKGTIRPYYEGELDPDNLVFPQEVDRADEWIPQVDVNTEFSVKYNDEDTVSFGLEYFYNGAGYDDPDIYPWLILNNAFQVFYLGRHYGVGYVRLANPGNIDDMSFTGSVLSNLSDKSAAARLDWRWTALTYLTLNVWGQGHFGQTGELRFGLDLPPMTGLPDGLKVNRPMVDAGLGAQVSF